MFWLCSKKKRKTRNKNQSRKGLRAGNVVWWGVGWNYDGLLLSSHHPKRIKKKYHKVGLYQL